MPFVQSSLFTYEWRSLDDSILCFIFRPSYFMIVLTFFLIPKIQTSMDTGNFFCVYSVYATQVHYQDESICVLFTIIMVHVCKQIAFANGIVLSLGCMLSLLLCCDLLDLIHQLDMDHDDSALMVTSVSYTVL